MQEFKVEHSNYIFRIKKMNAIQLLALRSQIDFDSYESTEKMYELILENIEVEFNNQWYVVRAKVNNEIIYHPNGIDEDIDLINELINYFMKEYLMKVFQKSAESK